MIDRNLKLQKNKSLFLLGPRKTGKSTFLKTTFPDAIYVDLLETDKFVKYTKEPWLFRQEVLFKVQENTKLRDTLIIIDEIQKVPILLNEVQKLIEEESLNFILSGSSARKLRNEGVNLLGGRAGRIYFNPLTLDEINDNYNLLDVLNKGKIPSIYLADDYLQELDSYINLYLKEEIIQEGLSRNLAVFSNFLKVSAFSQAEQVNFSNISRELSVDRRTVQEYFQILEDTLIGNFIYPYRANNSRVGIIKSPKFYFFDVGIANYLKGIKLLSTDGPQFGKSFEHLVYLEIKAYLDYKQIRKDICYWKTKEGLEVDFIIGNAEVSIEVKSGNLSNQDFEGILKFNLKFKTKKSFIIANISSGRILNNGLTVLSLNEFVKMLWKDEII